MDIEENLLFYRIKTFKYICVAVYININNIHVNYIYIYIYIKIHQNSIATILFELIFKKSSYFHRCEKYLENINVYYVVTEFLVD